MIFLTAVNKQLNSSFTPRCMFLCGGHGTKKVAPDVEQQYQYTEPTKCINPACQNTKDWELDMQARV